MEMKKEFIKLCMEVTDAEYMKGQCDSDVYKNFALESKNGKKLYLSFSDEELLDIIRSKAKQLDHSPSQKEVFWILKEYLKVRFQKWPYALKKAGLSSSAGRGGKTITAHRKEQDEYHVLLGLIRKKAKELGKVPHPKDMPEVCARIKKYNPNWGEIIEEAGINPEKLNEAVVFIISDLEEEYKEILKGIYEEAMKLGRAPMHNEIDEQTKEVLIKRCGSWRNALFQIGLEPVVRRRPFVGTYIDHRKDESRKHHTNVLYNCHYKVLNMDEETLEALEGLKSLEKELGRKPAKKDVDTETRKALQDKCGSWSNVLYQL